VHHGHDGLLEGRSKWRGVWGRYEFELEDDGLIVHFANFLDREDARGEIGLG
jgi:hypothetical protein